MGGNSIIIFEIQFTLVMRIGIYVRGVSCGKHVSSEAGEKIGPTGLLGERGTVSPVGKFKNSCTSGIARLFELFS